MSESDPKLRAVPPAGGSEGKASELDGSSPGESPGEASSPGRGAPEPGAPEAHGSPEAFEHAREDGPADARRSRRGIYLLPNLITTGALFAGFYAIVAGMNGHFVASVLAMFVAAALDAADGRIARWTRTESQFGAEYDSLSDMVAFGVAPALVAFSWGLSSLGQIGWVVTFVYMACAALRLARFNTKGESASFTGLASPSAAAVIACSVWIATESSTGPPTLLASSIMAAVTLTVALLMVSPFKYFSPKLFDMKGRVPFLTLVLVVFIFAVLLADPPRVLLVMSIAYALSGPLQAGWKRLRHRRGRVSSNEH